MKMITSMTALAVYAMSVTFVATANDATAGEYDFYVSAHSAISNGAPPTLVAALDKGEVSEMGLSDGDVTTSIIERAQAAFAAQLALDCGPGTQIDWVAEDAVYQYALSGIDVSLRMEGRDVVAEHLCALSAIAPDAIVGNIHYFPTLKPDLVYVQYDLVTTDGTNNRSSSLAIIQMRADQIVNFRQLSRSANSMAVLKSWL